MKPYWEGMLGCLVAAVGLVWGARIVTDNFTDMRNLAMPPGGPLEICALGTVVWLHSKFRIYTSPNR